MNPLKIIPEIKRMQGKRRLRRFFSEEPLPPEGERLVLSQSESRHLRQILRLKPGDICLVTDGSGREAEAEISGFNVKGEAALKIRSKRGQSHAAASCFIRALPAMTQKGKRDFLVEKAQELGVHAFWPVITARTEISLHGEAKERVMARWQKKVQEAAKQSGSLSLMEIGLVLPFEKALTKIPDGEQVVIFHPGPAGIPFEAWTQPLLAAAKQGQKPRLNLFFGPEGGFAEHEVALAKKQRPAAVMVHLGPSILRVETACLGVLAALRFLMP